MASSGDYRQEVLDLINGFRSLHQASPLRLDANLNNLAQEWANHLASIGSLSHRQNSAFGENLAMGWGPWDDVDNLVKLWYNEVNNFTFDQPFESAGHFTQLVWKSSQRLGVGKATATNGAIYLVTNYDPPGNSSGEYEKNVTP